MIKFWKESYNSDPVTFYMELVSFVFTIAAALYLAIEAENPNMLYVYPGFLVGSLLQGYASYKRGIAWFVVMAISFTVINLIGIGRVTGWI